LSGLRSIHGLHGLPGLDSVALGCGHGLNLGIICGSYGYRGVVVCFAGPWWNAFETVSEMVEMNQLARQSLDLRYFRREAALQLCRSEDERIQLIGVERRQFRVRW
jgi:hypothetical protein